MQENLLNFFSYSSIKNYLNNIFKKDEAANKKFGTFKGVYLPSILTIFGVIMYLRLGWIVGNVGLIGTILVVTLGTIITFLTGLSISATATNMKVEGGGAYYMISRSFGIEAGAAVGVPLFFARAIGVSFYIAGFAESVHSLFPCFSMPLIGIISLILLTVLAYISADAALKAQFFIFLIIISSLFSLFLGKIPVGGFKTGGLLLPGRVPFWVVFAVFFPAVTGFEAGLSMSGDLENPAKSLPLGTLTAVITGYIFYLVIPVFLYRLVPNEILISNPMVMTEIALVGGLIVLGIWGATLSSALGSLLGAPRTLQALARDHVLPGFLGKGFGAQDNPRIATAVSFIIALAGILLGDLNAIAPVLSMFFLTSYGVLNLIAGLEGLIGNPSWRPTFRVHWGFSFFGAVLCLMAMFMINAGATFIAIFIIFIIYILMSKRDLNARWSDIRRSILLFLARFSIYRLEESEADARTWRPNILVLSGSPTQRFYLIQIADAISHGKGFLTVASIVSDKTMTEDRLVQLEKSIKEFLRKQNIPALIEVTSAPDVIVGAKSLVKTYGLGPLAPNTILLGETEKKENFLQFTELIRLTYQAKRNMIIVREGDAFQKTIDKQAKQIDIWWGGKQRNAGLMLTLGYMLQTSPEFKGSRLIIKTIVRREEDRQQTIENLGKFLAEGRVKAESQVLVAGKNEDIIATTIRHFSQDADLVFLGIRPPELEETTNEYALYYESLMKATEKFPSIALVLAAEEIKFSEIFK
ncbi:MAG: amino acid permease [bacterium]